jgi:nitroreductase
MLMTGKTSSGNPRNPEYDVDSRFIDRWSPRSFFPEALSDEQVHTLFEAARWAPSCFNEQPWVFAFARSEADRALFASALSERNRLWASRAPLLCFVLARTKFTVNGKPNRWAAFDAGSAWMSLALQARQMGLYAHGMAGFNMEKAQEVLKINPEEHLILAAIAVGRLGDPSQLPEDMRAQEFPNDRRPQAAFVFEGMVPSGK